MTCLYVAAGGGGDALAAAMVHRALGHTEPAVIATYAWDRLWVDPLPGPRNPTEFRGLRPIGRRNFAITPDTEPLPPSGSTLPRLAAEIPDTVILLDPRDGAVGMRAQLTEMAHRVQPQSVSVVDVGGDAVANGDEPGLRSPLADGLVLAASSDIGPGLSVEVLVAGPGLDGELTESQVLDAAGGWPLVHVTDRDVARVGQSLEWHPSEATALLAAAARGIRGRVEIRDSGMAVDLSDESAAVYSIDLGRLVSRASLPKALQETTSLVEAEDVTRNVIGFCEIDYERAKARRSAGTQPSGGDMAEYDRVVEAFERDASTRGIDFVTFRRIAETIGIPATDLLVLRRHLVESRPLHNAWPLWAVNPMSATSSVDV